VPVDALLGVLVLGLALAIFYSPPESMRAVERSAVMRGAFKAAWSVARWVLLVAGLVIVIGGLLALAIWVVPDVLVGAPRNGLAEADRLKALNDARSPLVTVVGGLLLFTGALIGAVLTSRTIQVNRATLEVTRQGQITDRFTRAIDQLGQHGQDKLDVRLGGIYALERIARESAEDHGPIMEVLTAYLREHARVQPARSIPWQPVRTVGPMQLTKQARTTDGDKAPRLRTDFQAIATVLGRRPKERWWRVEDRLDLREVDLRVVNLNGAHLENAILMRAHLEGANLNGAHLKDAILGQAHLEGAYLTRADLEKANLSEAHLEGANLNCAHLKGAFLYCVHLERAKLGEANLEGANLTGANLERANLACAYLGRAHLGEAHLERANLGGADLERADLEGADFTGANLERANLACAYLGGAHLVDADLTRANLCATDLRGVLGLTRIQLEAAITDGATILPMFADEAPRSIPEPPS
jgi:uncharacterized protein YjbI with pentapeptide repeats